MRPIKGKKLLPARSKQDCRYCKREVWAFVPPDWLQENFRWPPVWCSKACKQQQLLEIESGRAKRVAAYLSKNKHL